MKRRGPRLGADTRAALLSAARTRFGTLGYEGTTVRAIAADVGVDPAMVIRYFENKEALFAEAAQFELHLPDLTGVPARRLAGVLLPHFFVVWENDAVFLPLLRAAATSATAAGKMRELFSQQVLPVLAAATLDHPEERAALVAAQILGLAFSRYVLQVPALVAMSHRELIAWISPVIRHHLTAKFPAG